jgi:hypothetical protein
MRFRRLARHVMGFLYWRRGGRPGRCRHFRRPGRDRLSRRFGRGGLASHTLCAARRRRLCVFSAACEAPAGSPRRAQLGEGLRRLRCAAPAARRRADPRSRNSTGARATKSDRAWRARPRSDQISLPTCARWSSRAFSSICLLMSVLLATVECAGNETAHALRGNVAEGGPGGAGLGQLCYGDWDCGGSLICIKERERGISALVHHGLQHSGREASLRACVSKRRPKRDRAWVSSHPRVVVECELPASEKGPRANDG